MPQGRRQHVVTIREDVGPDGHLFTDSPFNREPACVDVGADVLDDDAAMEMEGGPEARRRHFGVVRDRLIHGRRLPARHRLWTLDSRLWTFDYGLSTIDSRPMPALTVAPVRC